MLLRESLLARCNAWCSSPEYDDHVACLLSISGCSDASTGPTCKVLLQAVTCGRACIAGTLIVVGLHAFHVQHNS